MPLYFSINETETHNDAGTKIYLLPPPFWQDKNDVKISIFKACLKTYFQFNTKQSYIWGHKTF